MPQADRDRHVAYYQRTARAAYEHSCSILIGCPHRGTAEANNATGVFLRHEDHHYLLTADHVIEGFVNKITRDPPAHFQANDLVLNPLERLVFRDAVNDLALLALDPGELPDIGKTAYQPVGAWPPPPPTDGAYVQLVGFAKANRINGGHGAIENFSLHMTGNVQPRHDGNFMVVLDRDGIPTESVGLAVPPGESLGGMSGGPVMLYFQEPLPLIGIISEMSALMDAVLVSSLSHLRIHVRNSVSLP
jgi:hypothetical protein